MDLLEQKRLGLNKPNMLYLMKPNVTDSDIYQMQNEKTPVETRCGKEVKNFNFQKLTNLTSRSEENLLQEVNKINSNDTDINETTTTENIQGGSSEKLIILIENELTIKPTKAFVKKIKELSKNMNQDLLEYAIKYASENGNNPKQYLIKVLSVWQENHITTLEQAQNFKVPSKQQKVQSIEKTPRWITHPEEFKLAEEDTEALEDEVRAFKEHLNNKNRL